MKIVLVNLPWYCLGKTGVRAGSRWPHLRAKHEQGYLPFPFFLAYAAALLKKHGFDVVLVDAIAEGLTYRAFLGRLEELAPDLLVCETSTVTLRHDLGLLGKVDKDITVALCGPDANIGTPDFLKRHARISYILCAEYEYTLLELCRCLKEGGNKKEVAGLIYRQDKEVMVTGVRPLVPLDQLPWPLRDGLPMERYNDAPGNMPLPSVQMIASRGCPFRCKFCLWPQVMYQGNSYRTRDVSDVVAEMAHLVRDCGFKSVYFDDDTFNCGKARMLEFCAQIKQHGLNDIPWAIMARPDLMDEEILRNMKEAGLYAVKYGVESATQGLLDNINKNMDLAQAQKMIRLTEQLGIKTHLTFTFGLPGETKESIERTIAAAVDLNPNSVQFSITTPFPGTEFYKEMKEKGHILSYEWSEYDGNYRSVICSEQVTKKDLERAIRRGYRQWADHYLRRKILRGERLGLSPSRLFLYHLKKFGFLSASLRSGLFFYRFLQSGLLERTASLVRLFEKKPLPAGEISVGRLLLSVTDTGVQLFWEGKELTRQEGFSTAIAPLAGLQSDTGIKHRFLHFKKIDPCRFTVEKKYIGLEQRELWSFDVVDEKQIDWRVQIIRKDGVHPGCLRSAGVMLSQDYRNWVDSWGEGGFYPFFDLMEVELRNIKSKVIGVRGRKKLLGQMPTILIDASGNNGIVVGARNAGRVPGARFLEVRMIGNEFFSRIKIVEENFSKRKKKCS